ncbi:unnamed protein product [Adineta steineri]|uniref:Uncharacterized protein n=2 Tax=Adineta steineri TaxID=433720 RepID=A0A814IXQ5_9BILA|nr:unnamed protein product [Adineta steineri]
MIGGKETGMIESITNTKLLFHATTVYDAVSIICNGIDATSGRLNSDFRPGFYLNTCFKDAKDWCRYRITPHWGSQAAILIFQVPQNLYDQWNIHQLDHESPGNDSSSLNEWQLFVKKCRFGDRNNRIIGIYHGFEGPQCANPKRLENETLEIRFTNEARLTNKISLTNNYLEL